MGEAPGILGVFCQKHKNDSGVVGIYINSSDEYVEATATFFVYDQVKKYKELWEQKGEDGKVTAETKVKELGALKQFCRYLRSSRYYDNKRLK